ncbi:unnamed protein product [Diamesa tonsa]
MEFLTVILFAVLALAVRTEFIDIDWSKVKPISELPEFKAQRGNQRSVDKFNLNLRKIVGGKVASISQFPYQAGLLLNSSGSNFLCEGSLISSTRVLTAGHCAKDISSAVIILGAINLFEDEPTQVRINVAGSGLVCHPQYDLSSLKNDVAMVKLPSAVAFNNEINPIALPEGTKDYIGVTAVASGWGISDFTQEEMSLLRFVNLKIIKNAKCNEYLNIYDSTMCALGEGNADTCFGDSGGPFAVKKNGKKILVGITSFGIESSCGHGIPTGFARVSSFIPWIKENIELPEFKAQRESQAPFYKINLNHRKIVGGKVASISQFPYQAGLLLKASGTNYLCGGSLISRTRVLTAGHCAKDTSSAIVILGANNLREDEPTQVIMNVSRIYHPEYDDNTLHNDIAMIKLPSAVTFNDHISPIALPEGSDDYVAEGTNNFAGVNAVLSGWGRFGSTQASSTFLRFVNLQVITNLACRVRFPTIIQDSTICANGEGNVGGCNGDSGGPLSVQSNGQSLLVGVTSFVSGVGCERGFPTGFARVSSFIPWIQSHM